MQSNFILNYKIPIRIILGLLTFLITSCSKNERLAQFDTKTLDNQLQPFAYELENIGKDTCNTLSIVSTSTDVIFKLKGQPLMSVGKSTDSLSYYIDSSTDGGRSWSNTEEVLRGKDKVELLASKNGEFKYLVGLQEVYFSNSGIQFRRLPLDFSYYRSIEWFQFDADKNTLVLLINRGGGYLLCKISGSEVKNVRINMAYVNYKAPKFYYNDTFYSLVNNFQETKILKIDSNGSPRDTISLAFSKFDDAKLFLVNKSDYYYYGNYRVLGYDRVSAIHFINYGIAYKIDSLLPFLDFHYFEGDSMLLAWNSLWENTKYFLSYDYGKTWGSFTDTIFYTDHHRNVFFCNLTPLSDYGNKPFLIAADAFKSGYYYNIFRLHKKKIQSFASLESYSVFESPGEIKVKVNLRNGSPHEMLINLLLFGVSNQNYKEDKKRVKLIARFKPSSRDLTEWEASFSPDSIGITSGQKYNLELYFSDHTKENHYDFPVFTYTPVSFYTDHKNVFTLVFILLSILAFLGLLTLFFPYSMYLLHSKLSFLRPLTEDSTNKFAIAFKLLDSLTIVPLFAYQPRVLDAWIKKNKEKLMRGFQQEPSFQSHTRDLKAKETIDYGQTKELNYLPLPISFHMEKGKVVEPNAEIVGKYFTKDRMCLEIVGIGGIGKTTLALQIGEWTGGTVNRKYFQDHLWLPIFIDEETVDIFQVVVRKVNTMINGELDKDFLKRLLRKNRLLIIIDALSEKTTEMQQHIVKIYNNAPVNALLLTTRYKINIEGVDEIYCYPKTMDGSKVLDYITAYFANTNIDIFKSEVNNSKLLTKIMTRFQVAEEEKSQDDKKEIPIIPIVVNLILEKLKSFVDQNQSRELEDVFDQIPNSIPDVFSDYLIRVNPKQGPNIIPDAAMLYYAETLAEICLGDSFIPQKITQTSIEDSLIKANIKDVSMIINRFVDNGVLTSQKVKNDYFIGFEFDPIAEYLAAIRKAKSCGTNIEEWKKLYASIDSQNAKNFCIILETVHISCAALYKWVSFAEFKMITQM